MVRILIAYTPPAPALAKMVIRTCSLILNGPRFSEKYQLVHGNQIFFVGSLAAMRWPKGRTTIWAKYPDIVSGFDLNMKNWFATANVTQGSKKQFHTHSSRSHVNFSDKMREKHFVYLIAVEPYWPPRQNKEKMEKIAWPCWNKPTKKTKNNSLWYKPTWGRKPTETLAL